VAVFHRILVYPKTFTIYLVTELYIYPLWFKKIPLHTSRPWTDEFNPLNNIEPGPSEGGKEKYQN